MTELEAEQGRLALANRHLDEGTARVSRQEALVGTLTKGTAAYQQAEDLLETLAQTLEEWRGHRDLIEERIGVLKSR